MVVQVISSSIILADRTRAKLWSLLSPPPLHLFSISSCCNVHFRLCVPALQCICLCLNFHHVGLSEFLGRSFPGFFLVITFSALYLNPWEIICRIFTLKLFVFVYIIIISVCNWNQHIWSKLDICAYHSVFLLMAIKHKYIQYFTLENKPIVK